jgi:acyl-CoA synthetase (AMP-forming)/AMP-acid ligase II
MKDALRRRGENISSFEVERVINEFPAVYESAVVAVPSELTEDEIKAVVVPRPGERVDPAELTRFLVDRLPYFMGWVGGWRGDAVAFRFQPPPVEPCMRFSRTRLTDVLHRRCSTGARQGRLGLGAMTDPLRLIRPRASGDR